MSFAWPLALLSVLVVPLIVGVYWWLLRRRRRQAVRYSSVALLRSVIPRRKRWQRHLPIALVLASLLALGLAAARPHVVRDVPYARTSIILALDVSGSMCSTDVKPNRLVVAQEASRAFVEDQPDEVRMGLVVFSGFAELAVPPTTERSELMSTIDTVTTGRGTAIGGAILKGLDAIAEVNPAVQPVGDVFALDDTPSPGSGGAPPRSEDYVADIIVLLTDGRNTRGIEPLDAVPHAIERRVRVYTIGFGTTEPAELSCTREQLGGRVFGGGFGGGAGFGGLWRCPLRGHTDPDGDRRADRWDVSRRRGRGSAPRGLRRASEGSGDAAAADRDHVDARRTRCAPRRRRGGSLDPLEPVPVAQRTAVGLHVARHGG